MSLHFKEWESDTTKYIKATLERYEKYLNPFLSRELKTAWLPSVAREARGCYISDLKGETYLDCLSGYGVLSLGYSNPEVIKAVKSQLEEVAFSTKFFCDGITGQLAETLARLSPGDLQYSLFCESGLEAVEAALKVVRHSRKRQGIVCTYNSFHSYPLTELNTFSSTNFRFVPYGDLETVKTALDDSIAALIVEPIQVESGVVIPSPGYLKGLRRICDDNNILLIIDEIQTGLGRTGYLFACDYEKVVPDILILGKALGGGILPAGAVLFRPHLSQALQEDPLYYTTTFGGYPLASAAALATLRILTETNLILDVQDKGYYLLQQLHAFAKIFPTVVKEIRGRGLIVGIELTDERAGAMIMAKLLEQKVITAPTLQNRKVIRLEPPLFITYEEIDYITAALNNAIKYAEELLNI
ncbi:MAG: ornithine aminotransferase [Peptococcaceae bacterium]|jgi:putrescine aminotransferase|nr:ornithine aminotransferase [Peptococcaceae bacterium]